MVHSTFLSTFLDWNQSMSRIYEDKYIVAWGQVVVFSYNWINNLNARWSIPRVAVLQDLRSLHRTGMRTLIRLRAAQKKLNFHAPNLPARRRTHRHLLAIFFEVTYQARSRTVSVLKTLFCCNCCISFFARVSMNAGLVRMFCMYTCMDVGSL